MQRARLGWGGVGAWPAPQLWPALSIVLESWQQPRPPRAPGTGCAAPHASVHWRSVGCDCCRHFHPAPNILRRHPPLGSLPSLARALPHGRSLPVAIAPSAVSALRGSPPLGVAGSARQGGATGYVLPCGGSRFALPCPSERGAHTGVLGPAGLPRGAACLLLRCDLREE